MDVNWMLKVCGPAVDGAMEVPESQKVLGGVCALQAGESSVNVVLNAWQDPGLVHVVDHKLHVRQEPHEPAQTACLDTLKPGPGSPASKSENTRQTPFSACMHNSSYISDHDVQSLHLLKELDDSRLQEGCKCAMMCQPEVGCLEQLRRMRHLVIRPANLAAKLAVPSELYFKRPFLTVKTTTRGSCFAASSCAKFMLRF